MNFCTFGLVKLPKVIESYYLGQEVDVLREKVNELQIEVHLLHQKKLEYEKDLERWQQHERYRGKEPPQEKKYDAKTDSWVMWED